MKKLILLSMLTLCLTACGYRGLGGSFVGNLPEDAAVASIAADTSAYIMEQYAPGHTRLLVLTPEKDAHNAYSAALEADLRQKGYEVLQESASNAVTVAYTLDSLKGEDGKDVAWYVQLRFSDGQAIARVYNADGSAAAGRTATTLQRGLFQRAADKANRAADAAVEKLGEVFDE